jgi:hypothetical protein
MEDWYLLFEWFEATTIGTVVRESLWLFPVIQCVHLLALALMGGAVIVVDLRLLGLGLRGQSMAELARQAQPWLVAGWAGMLSTGIPMFLSEAIKCFYSPPFWYKMSFLVIATIFTFSWRRRVTGSDAAGPVARGLTALASLGLWFGVGFSGRWIAFY